MYERMLVGWMMSVLIPRIDVQEDFLRLGDKRLSRTNCHHYWAIQLASHPLINNNLIMAYISFCKNMTYFMCAKYVVIILTIYKFILICHNWIINFSCIYNVFIAWLLCFIRPHSHWSYCYIYPYICALPQHPTYYISLDRCISLIKTLTTPARANGASNIVSLISQVRPISIIYIYIQWRY